MSNGSSSTTSTHTSGEGVPIIINKTVTSGDGSVRMEMRFRSHSASMEDGEENDQIFRRQQSAPASNISGTPPTGQPHYPEKENHSKAKLGPTEDIPQHSQAMNNESRRLDSSTIHNKSSEINIPIS